MKTDTAPTALRYGYEVIVTERHGRFYLRIPELSLIAEGPDIATAHAALDQSRRQLIERHEAIGAAVPAPRDVRLRRTLIEQVAPFALKAALVALVASTLLISSAVTVNYVMRDQLRHASQRMARAALLQITAGLEDFARRDLTPDREERLRNGLRGAVPVLRPFIEELQPVFNETKPRP